MNLLKKIFSPLCLLISSILLIYTFYKAEIVWGGEKSNYYTIYYVISLIAFVFSIISFYFDKKIKDYLIIFFVSIIGTFYTFEIYLKFFNNPGKSNKVEIYKKNTGKDYDTRNKKEIYNDLKKIDKNVTLMTYPTLLLGKKTNIFPLSNKSNSTTIYCNENGYYSIYKSDRYGFNNPDIEWDKKEIDYLLVGDSFVHGACVNRPNDIASVLRNVSNKSVLNLGFGDNGPLLEYATLREYLKPNVKKVIWFYFEGNDLLGLKDKLSNEILNSYLNDLTFTQGLKNKQSDIDELVSNIIEEEIKKVTEIQNKTKFFLFKNIIKLYYTRTLIFNKQEPELIPDFKNILKLTKDLTSKNNSKLYFVYLPEYKRYQDNYNYSNYLGIKKIVEELDITMIDMHLEVFKKIQNPHVLFPFEEPGGHYTVEGYKKIAQKIFELSK